LISYVLPPPFPSPRLILPPIAQETGFFSPTQPKAFLLVIVNLEFAIVKYEKDCRRYFESLYYFWLLTNRKLITASAEGHQPISQTWR